jgi:hypothetical protein
MSPNQNNKAIEKHDEHEIKANEVIKNVYKLHKSNHVLESKKIIAILKFIFNNNDLEKILGHTVLNIDEHLYVILFLITIKNSHKDICLRYDITSPLNSLLITLYKKKIDNHKKVYDKMVGIFGNPIIQTDNAVIFYLPTKCNARFKKTIVKQELEKILESRGYSETFAFGIKESNLDTVNDTSNLCLNTPESNIIYTGRILAERVDNTDGVAHISTIDVNKVLKDIKYNENSIATYTFNLHACDERQEELKYCRKKFSILYPYFSEEEYSDNLINLIVERITYLTKPLGVISCKYNGMSLLNQLGKYVVTLKANMKPEDLPYTLWSIDGILWKNRLSNDKEQFYTFDPSSDNTLNKYFQKHGGCHKYLKQLILSTKDVKCIKFYNNVVPILITIFSIGFGVITSYYKIKINGSAVKFNSEYSELSQIIVKKFLHRFIHKHNNKEHSKDFKLNHRELFIIIQAIFNLFNVDKDNYLYSSFIKLKEIFVDAPIIYDTITHLDHLYINCRVLNIDFTLVMTEKKTHTENSNHPFKWILKDLIFKLSNDDLANFFEIFDLDQSIIFLIKKVLSLSLIENNSYSVSKLIKSNLTAILKLIAPCLQNDSIISNSIANLMGNVSSIQISHDNQNSNEDNNKGNHNHDDDHNKKNKPSVFSGFMKQIYNMREINTEKHNEKNTSVLLNFLGEEFSINKHYNKHKKSHKTLFDFKNLLSFVDILEYIIPVNGDGNLNIFITLLKEIIGKPFGFGKNMSGILLEHGSKMFKIEVEKTGEKLIIDENCVEENEIDEKIDEIDEIEEDISQSIMEKLKKISESNKESHKGKDNDDKKQIEDEIEKKIKNCNENKIDSDNQFIQRLQKISKSRQQDQARSLSDIMKL